MHRADWLKRADAFHPHFLDAARFLSRVEPERGLRSVIVSSCAARQGVSTAVYDIARGLHDLVGMRTLVVELNQWSPRFGSLFGLDPERTLEQVQRGSIHPCEALQKLEEGIGCVPAPWGAGARPSPVLSATVDRVLEHVRSSVDFVLFDAPSILHHGECRTAGVVVPRVVLVLKSGHTRSRVVDRAVEDLHRENIEIVGSVITNRRQVIPQWLYRRIA